MSILAFFCEKGVCTGLTTLPIQDHDFTLYKSAFRDALYLRYVWMGAKGLSLTVYLWKAIKCRACLELPNV